MKSGEWVLQMVSVFWAVVSEQNQLIHSVLSLPWEFCLLSLLAMAKHCCCCCCCCFTSDRLCATPQTATHQAPLSLGFSRQEHWSGLPFPSPMHESGKWKWKWSHSVLSNSSGPHGLQLTRLLLPWDFPGKSAGVGCHYCGQTRLIPLAGLLGKEFPLSHGPEKGKVSYYWITAKFLE